ncbi:MAG: hypothetical protein IPN01_15390 [Deltaproteobacteria bacterium]|nr:hypothetical protein [Deltaproteobacteria bacterium]
MIPRRLLGLAASLLALTVACGKTNDTDDDSQAQDSPPEDSPPRTPPRPSPR